MTPTAAPRSFVEFGLVQSNAPFCAQPKVSRRATPYNAMAVNEHARATKPAAPTAASEPMSSTSANGTAMAAAAATSTPSGTASGVALIKSWSATRYETATPNIRTNNTASAIAAQVPPAASRANAANGDSRPASTRRRAASSSRLRDSTNRWPAQSFQTSSTSSARTHGTTPPVEKACGTDSTPTPMQSLSMAVTAPRNEVLPALRELWSASGKASPRGMAALAPVHCTPLRQTCLEYSSNQWLVYRKTAGSGVQALPQRAAHLSVAP